MISCSGVNWSAGSGALLRRTMAALLRDNWVRSKTAQLAHGPATAQSLGFVERAGLPVVDREASHKETIVGETGKVRANLPIPHTVSAELTRPDKTLALSASCVPIGYSASSAVSLGKLARNSRRTSRARLKRSLQWNTAILSAAPLHPETFHHSFIYPLNLGPDNLALKSHKPGFFQAVVWCASGRTSCRRPVSTSKTKPRTGTSFEIQGCDLTFLICSRVFSSGSL